MGGLENCDVGAGRKGMRANIQASMTDEEPVVPSKRMEVQERKILKLQDKTGSERPEALCQTAVQLGSQHEG